MYNQINRVLVDMNQFLSKYPQKNNCTIEETEKVLLDLLNFNNKLKTELYNYQFQDQQEEINFFKSIKPFVISKLILYNNLYRIKIENPSYCFKSEYKYYKRELLKLQHFFEDNREFYKYYKTNSTYLDTKFFIRNKHNIRMILDSYLTDFDLNYTTSHCFKLAQVIAFDELQVYLKQKMTEFFHIPQKNRLSQKPKFIPKWTANNRDLVELIYALQANRSINHGLFEIKEMVEFFELNFDIQLNGYYNDFKKIKDRKGINTRFLDELKTALLDKIRN